MEVADSATGELYIGHGVYREVTPPQKLVFTWAWKKRLRDGSEADLQPESLVTVEFWEQGASTEVLLTHEFLQTEKAAKSTEEGWKGCFDALALVLEGS